MLRETHTYVPPSSTDPDTDGAATESDCDDSTGPSHTEDAKDNTHKQIPQGKQTKGDDYEKREVLLRDTIAYFQSKQYKDRIEKIRTAENSKACKQGLTLLINEVASAVTGTEVSDDEDLADVKVVRGDLEWESLVEWDPPRPAKDIYDQGLDAVADLIMNGSTADAGALLFQLVGYIHPLSDGNGRTSRFLYAAFATPDYLNIPYFIDLYLRSPLFQEASRKASDKGITEAINKISRTYQIDNYYPILRHGDEGAVSNTSYNRLWSIAYQIVQGKWEEDEPLLVNLADIPKKIVTRMKDVVRKLQGEIIKNVIEDPSSREAVHEELDIRKILGIQE
jgi:hypothetical protein